MTGDREVPDEAAPAGERARAARDGAPVVVHGDVTGIVATGAHSLNVIYDGRALVEITSLRDLTPRQPPPLPAAGRTTLFGRDALVADVVARIRGGGSAQLYGKPGVGKKAVAAAVHRELAVQGRRGHVLYPRTGADEEESLQTLYGRLAGALFGTHFLRAVDETQLRAAVAAADFAGAHLTVIDCALPQSDLTRLLETFPGCTFLFTSPYATLPDTEGAHPVRPLSRTAAVELLSAEIGLPLGPAGLRNLQFDHVWRESGGEPQRICQYAQFIKGIDQWERRVREDGEPPDEPAPVDPALLSPRRQAEALAVALSEPARRALLALATFGTALPAAWIAPVTGYPQDGAAVAELHDRRLVRHVGGAYGITEDAAAAVRGQEWAPAAAATAAEGLLAAFARQDGPSGPEPDPYLFLAVARALVHEERWALAARFARTAGPRALTQGRGQPALQLYVLGRMAAARSGLAKEVEFYDRAEKLTRDLLDGDKAGTAAVAAVLLAPALGAAAVEGGKTLGFLGKLAATVSTKTGAAVTAGAVVVAATTVVVAVNANAMPAGCKPAYAALEAYSGSDKTRTYDQLADDTRTLTSALRSAAAEASEADIKSKFTQHADGLDTETAAAVRKNREQMNVKYPPHPDVIAALAGSERLRHQISTLQAIRAVCPSE
ncbi:hypothetical protein ADL22_20505 [Streptomyces sp. NRRL F-4489]|uniref:ATP-binding protein n=1 Tax=Streptomyces sp. NRRL F-4489 TaxID=1609095 RepID=UPI0007478761|nr:ATP-binding protein [Streptomyces sp. NRRL F-4489]KUL37773.1 hypothetical protein ADL22_20505 [Streptomyces sp. NRRL F-4489]